MVSTTTELTWLIILLRDIGIPLLYAPQLFCDNLNALHMRVNPLFHVRTKHIKIDYHFVPEKVVMGHHVTRFVSSSHQIADIFTKSLSYATFGFLYNKIRLHLHSLSTLKGSDKEDIKTDKKVRKIIKETYLKEERNLPKKNSS